MNLIPVEGSNVLSGNPDLDIVLGSAPPSPTPSELALQQSPLPALPSAQPTATAQPSTSPSAFTAALQPPAPHLESPSPRDALATSLQQLSGEAAFLPRSLGERTVSNTLYSGQGNKSDLASLQPGQSQAMTRAVSEEAELYIPGLMSTSLFVMLPTVSLRVTFARPSSALTLTPSQTDSLTPLIEKYLSPQQRTTRDLSGAWRGRSLEQLIVSSVVRLKHDLGADLRTLAGFKKLASRRRVLSR